MTEQVTPGGAYDVPNASEVYGAEEASAAIDKVNAAWLADPAHPYMNANHPQHQSFVDAVNQLYKVKFADVDARTPLQKAMAEAMESQEVGQEQRIGESQRMVEELVDEFGWQSFQVPDDILPCERDCLSMLLDVEKGNWDTAIGRLDKAIVQHPGSPPEVHQALSQLRELNKRDSQNASHDAKRIAALVVLQWLRDEGRKRLGLAPREEMEGGNNYAE